jgi:hypothetical protein
MLRNMDRRRYPVAAASHLGCRPASPDRIGLPQAGQTELNHAEHERAATGSLSCRVDRTATTPNHPSRSVDLRLS